MSLFDASMTHGNINCMTHFHSKSASDTRESPTCDRGAMVLINIHEVNPEMKFYVIHSPI